MQPVDKGAIAGHPCACRENLINTKPAFARAGPSLRVQGEHPSTTRTTQASRAIPARAGRTYHCPLYLKTVTGHPCACRENPFTSIQRISVLGPSLRVQGEQIEAINRNSFRRAIPARARRTGQSAGRRGRKTRYPCACRENFFRSLGFL